MQRERGKVSTKINKEMVAGGSSEIKATNNWRSHLIPDTKIKEGKSVTLLTQKLSHKRATIDKATDKKPIINKPKEKPRDHDQPTHDH